MKIQSSRHFLAKLAARRMFRASRLLPLTVALCAALATAPAAQALTGTFNGATDATWATDTNWTSGAHPVTGDTAFFTNDAPTVNNRTTIDLGAGQAAAAVTFDSTTAAAYTIGAGAVGSQTLTLDNTGAVTLGLLATSAPATSQLFNANVVLGTGAVGTTTITNNATLASGIALTFAGTVTGGTGGTAGAKTLNTAGTGVVNFTGPLSAGGSTSLSVANIGTGTTTLSGTGTIALNTLRATASGIVAINGPTVTVAASSGFGGSSSTFGRFILTAGSVAFNGGITSGNTADQILYRVDGGTFTASSVTVGRNQSFTALPAASSTTSGFIVNGGTATVTGNVLLGTSNSSATGLQTGGSLTVGGAFNLGQTTNTRYSVFEVRGGTFNSTDTANGLVMSISTTSLNNTEFLFTGGTSTAQRISFGVANSFAGSTGTLAVNGAAAALYVGSGGIVQTSANAYTSTVNLTAGTLGAAADWTSAVPMNLNGAAGTSFTIQAADAANVAHNISLTGAIGGAGGITKTGGGTLTLTAANFYTGLTTVNAGTLNINGVNALGGGNYAGITINGGMLQYSSDASTANNGSLDVSNIGGTAKPFTIGAGGATIGTNTNSVTYANTIGNNGTGSLTKAGVGVLTLAAANTYTGGTTINGGTLTITANGGLSSGNVTVTAGTTLELGVGVTAAHSLATTTLTLLGTNSIVMLDAAMGTVQDTVQTLIINGVTQRNGTYGAPGSGATNTTLPEFMGTGILTVVPEPSTWVMMFGGIAGLVILAARRQRNA